jgi:hypothetical protein
MSFSSFKHINKTIAFRKVLKMKISQILESQTQLDELDMTNAAGATGGVVGKTANALGAVAGGVKGAWDAAKAGFQSGKNFVGGQRAGSTDPKAINQQGPAGTAPAQAVQGSAGTAMGNMGKAMSGQKPAQAGQTLYATVKQQINNIDPQSKQKLLNLIQKSVQQKQPKQGGQQSGVLGQMANTLAGGGQQAPAQPNTMANAPVSATNTAPPATTQQAAPADQAPAATPATTQQAAGNAPLTAQQQAAKKAELLGKRAAGKTTASQTGSGFNQYVQGGGGSTLAGADAQGNPVFKQNVKRESYEFESKFLGRMI